MSSALLIIERKEQILSLLYQENRLVQVKVYEDSLNKQHAKVGEDSSSSLPLHAIYIGKVKNVVPSIEAAFVEVNQGRMGFLPMKQAKNPIILNRKYDGRIVAGDEILVQIEKEGIKTKDPGLTCNLSFTGKYCVLTTGKQGIGFSTKLKHSTKVVLKEKIKEWNLENALLDENVGMVVRTNVSNLIETANDTDHELCTNAFKNFEHTFKGELEALFIQKRKILDSISYRTCFSCLYQPIEGYLLDIRDTYENFFDKIITNNTLMYDRICEEFPDMQNVELYEDSRIPLDRLYSVETRLQEALEERVWLKSGAYLIIQQTEALTVIDVNSGKIQKKNPKDDIFFEINKEAAREIALQLKLRNLSGIIIVDFINQNTKEQDNELLSYLSNLVKRDPVKTNVIDMTPLGLVEITRKKIHKSLKEQLNIR